MDVVANIEGMSEQVSGFQGAVQEAAQGAPRLARVHRLSQEDRRLPEILPLLQALSPPDMRDRHWAELGASPGVEFNLAEWPYLQAAGSSRGEYAQSIRRYRGFCALAPSRRRRWRKLAVIDEDWAEQVFSFAPSYKNSGEVILKMSTTAELIEKLEDTQMALGSMATNRYSAPFKEEVAEWIAKLSTVSEIVEMWLVAAEHVDVHGGGVQRR